MSTVRTDSRSKKSTMARALHLLFQELNCVIRRRIAVSVCCQALHRGPPSGTTVTRRTTSDTSHTNLLGSADAGPAPSRASAPPPANGALDCRRRLPFKRRRQVPRLSARIAIPGELGPPYIPRPPPTASPAAGPWQRPCSPAEGQLGPASQSRRRKLADLGTRR